MAKRLFVGIVASSLSAPAAQSEQITSFAFEEGVAGYACSVTMAGASGATLSVQLSDYQDVWSVIFSVAGKREALLAYFDDLQLADYDRFLREVASVTVGSEVFPLTDASFFAVQASDVDNETRAQFSIETRHQSASVVQAMAVDGVSFGDFASFTGTQPAFADFRTCSLSALGVADGETVPTDFREEFRLIFESSFEAWITAMARAQSCGVLTYNDDVVADVANQAAAAFYPGLSNYFQRGTYADDLLSGVPLAELSGMNDAASDGCLMADELAELARLPVDKAISAAQDLD